MAHNRKFNPGSYGMVSTIALGPRFRENLDCCQNGGKDLNVGLRLGSWNKSVCNFPRTGLVNPAPAASAKICSDQCVQKLLVISTAGGNMVDTLPAHILGRGGPAS